MRRLMKRMIRVAIASSSAALVAAGALAGCPAAHDDYPGTACKVEQRLLPGRDLPEQHDLRTERRTWRSSGDFAHSAAADGGTGDDMTRERHDAGETICEARAGTAPRRSSPRASTIRDAHGAGLDAPQRRRRARHRHGRRASPPSPTIRPRSGTTRPAPRIYGDNVGYVGVELDHAAAHLHARRAEPARPGRHHQQDHREHRPDRDPRDRLSARASASARRRRRASPSRSSPTTRTAAPSATTPATSRQDRSRPNTDEAEGRSASARRRSSTSS